MGNVPHIIYNPLFLLMSLCAITIILIISTTITCIVIINNYHYSSSDHLISPAIRTSSMSLSNSAGSPQTMSYKPISTNFLYSSPAGLISYQLLFHKSRSPLSIANSSSSSFFMSVHSLRQ